VANGYKELYRHRAIPELLTSRLVENFGFAIMSGVWSILLFKEGLTDGEIGVVRGLAVILTLLTSLLLPRLLEKYDESIVYPLSLALAGVMAFLAGAPSVILITIAFLSVRLLNSVKQSSFSVMFRDSFRKITDYTMAQGVLSGLMSFAWLIGPFAGGFIMDKFDPVGAMYVSGCFLILASIIAAIKRVPHITKQVRSDLNPIANISFFTKIRGLNVSYMMKSGIDVWWAFIFTFLPLFMLENGYSLFEIGMVLGLTQLPLVIGEFVTLRSLNTFSFKTIFSGCYLYLLLISLLAFSLTQSSIIIAALIAGSVALSFLEPLCEVFFFSLTTKEEEERAYPIFNTSSSFGEGLFSLGLGMALTALSFRYSFLIVAVAMLVLYLFARRIHKVPYTYS
jgi:MFS family permease